jgi:Activator of Hsp90 ATPase homolog 1-like protein
VRDKKRSFIWDLLGTKDRELLVTFLLEPFDSGTVLTLTHEHLPNKQPRTSHQQGWNGFLDKLLVFLGDFK